MPAYPVPRASTHYITCDVTSKLRRKLHNAMHCCSESTRRMAREAAKACCKLLCCRPVLLVQGEVVSGGKVKHTPSTAVNQHGWREWAMSLGGRPAWVCEGSTTRAFVQRLTPQEACAWWGRAFSADIDRHPPPVRPITRSEGVLCDIDGAPKR